MFSSFSNFFCRSREAKSQPLLEEKLLSNVVYEEEEILTPSKLLEKLTNDVYSYEMLYHCLLKSLGLIVIGGGIVAGIYIVRALQYADATRDTSEETGCYDSCGMDSVFGRWMIAGLEGIGACVVCCIGGVSMACNPSYGDADTLIENLPNKIKLYVNEFLESHEQIGIIKTMGDLRQFCQRLQLEHNIHSQRV
jgi:hypothetical protein